MREIVLTNGEIALVDDKYFAYDMCTSTNEAWTK